jgi:hypothetical protein
MALAHGVVKFLRMLHLHVGVFAAPALLFFAFTGGLQTFGLHEAARGSSYTPPAWLASAAQLHKKATIVMPVRRTRPPVARGADVAQPSAVSVTRAAGTEATMPAARAPAWLLAMKIFFAVISLSLLFSVLSGLVVAYRVTHRPHLLNALILAGTLLPIVLLP